MGISKKLETIYHNGQPDGIRSIRRSLSTMTTYVIPRPLLSEAKNITGINRHGIYYLIDCACLFSKRNTDITSNIEKA